MTEQGPDDEETLKLRVQLSELAPTAHCLETKLNPSSDYFWVVVYKGENITRGHRTKKDALQEAVSSLKAATADPAKMFEKLRDLILECGTTFRLYEELHRAKGTPEGNQKAEKNAAMARKCTDALVEMKKGGHIQW